MLKMPSRIIITINNHWLLTMHKVIYSGDIKKGMVITPTLSAYKWRGQSSNKCQVAEKQTSATNRCSLEKPHNHGP